MKHVIFVSLLGFSSVMWGQVPQNPQGTQAVPQQAAMVSPEVAWWLANPQALFQQLDVDRDGLLNYAEFSRVGVLNTQVVVPAGQTTVPANGGSPVYTPATGVPPANSFPRMPSMKPMTGPNGPYSPSTGVPPTGGGGAPRQ